VHLSTKDRSDNASKLLYHSLELNEIHLALKRTGSLVWWMPETEIRSRTDLTSQGYWKYCDVVVVVRLPGQGCKFALEYERTPKAVWHYFNICQRIQREASIAASFTLSRTMICCGLWQTSHRSVSERSRFVCYGNSLSKR
jgi:hypothetical protein